MLFTMKYPLELRLKVVEDYSNNEGGYKKLAKKYGVSRDLVRFWVLGRHRKIPREVISMEKSNEQKDDELKSLRLQVDFYKALSENLEKKIKKEKKKLAAKQFKNLQKKDIQ